MFLESMYSVHRVGIMLHRLLYGASINREKKRENEMEERVKETNKIYC